ncbi:MAG TPA: D-glycero-beta-D-manno-heptose-7-phosphate kinase [Azospirillaceae bacterium]|nr:D-glycero-beta-D-manno-heptose-7-phosphate kinase [Azospirillaceae bacterium]
MSDLTALIAALRGAPVLCVGDAMLDRFTVGTVERISPEAPIPVLRVERESLTLGGAGNVACNLAALGASVRFLSVVGDDPEGATLSALAAERLDGGAELLVEPGRQTGVKTRFLAGGQQLLRADRETVAAVSAETASRLLARALDIMPGVRAVILSDYGKGVLADGLLRAIIDAAKAAGLPVLVDPKGSDYRRYRGAGIVTPNRKELAQASGLPVGTDAQVEKACRLLMRDCGLGAVVATRSEQGMSVVAETSVHHLPAEAREVFDVSGAGDTVVAALAAALAAGAALPDAARLANLAAGIVVAKVGTAVVRPDELAAALNRQGWEAAGAKVLSRAAAVERVEAWRRQGRRVGFTNGCFDLLHPGHISLLGQARAACDRLVVGLNSDASVKRLKGESRPVQGEAARATVLASLASVDLVVLFGEDTPLALIEALRPDVLVKGADYTIDKVVGADLVQGWGGRVVLADLVEGQSTTKTIAKMQG